MMTTTKTFDIQLGQFKASYRGYQTTAPEDYDGFGTITLHRNSPELRWVLVRVEHENWQIPRYRSGLYSVIPFDSDNPDAPSLGEVEQWITDRLYQRMTENKDQ